MKMTGNTMLITGGGSGIGRGLAEEFQKRGNQVIIAGRRQSALDETCAANPGMKSLVLDIEDPASIAEAAAQVKKDFPALNVLMNNAGIMRETYPAKGALDEKDLTETINTNLFGPLRLTGALLDGLKQQKDAAIVNVTSGLAYIPLVSTSVYCATKAALHSYTLSLRWDLRETGVKVIELIPPYVQTELFRGANDPRAMPLADFIAEAMDLFATDADEVTVERVKFLRNPDAGRTERKTFEGFNEMMAQHGR